MRIPELLELCKKILYNYKRNQLLTGKKIIILTQGMPLLEQEWLTFCPFSFDRCVFCPSSIYGF